MFTESESADMSSAASTATNDSACTVVEVLVPSQSMVDYEIPNSSCISNNSVNSIGGHQSTTHQHKQQPQTDTDYYLKLAQAPSSSSGMKTTTLCKKKTKFSDEITSK